VKEVRGPDAEKPLVKVPVAECVCGRGVWGAVGPLVTESRCPGSAREGRSSVTTDGIWSYAPDSGYVEGQDLTGFSVVADDGTIGHVDRQAAPHGMGHLVVDTGVWVFGRSVLVPVGVVTRVDPDGRRVTLACTGAEVKAAPRFRTDSETTDREYLAAVGAYYQRLTTTA
jgi:hypothetical protein